MRIKPIDAAEAPPEVRELYRRAEELLGSVPAPQTVMAQVPPLLMAANQLGAAISGSKVVAPRLKTLASLRAAQMAGCPF
ncbi:MAG: hypothetical protein IVW54_08115 [Candidatus Binataceae bacterium]|nr:hypothetical protein [Candidatus Binataceae bacterium]